MSARIAPPRTVTRPELLAGGSDREFRMFIHDLFALATRVETVRSGFGGMIGLSAPQYTILTWIGHLQGRQPVGVTTLARYLGLSAAFVTVETGRLLRMGLIEKRADTEDGRRVQLSLTPKGWERLAKLAPNQAKVNDLIFQNLSAREFRQLRRLLAKLVTGAERGMALLAYLVARRELEEGEVTETALATGD